MIMIRIECNLKHCVNKEEASENVEEMKRMF